MFKECYVILRKILRVVGELPLTADDIHSKRSAHGTFANVLQELARNQVCVVCVCIFVFFIHSLLYVKKTRARVLCDTECEHTFC